jgi:2-polyprenyl-3-methyl-5-hydroxy-6-metoxy-1,4-benzoquinol methylase
MEKPIDRVLLDRFTTVFQKRLWGSDGSLSGPGSRRDNPMVVSAVSGLTAVIAEFQITSIADIPCGDFQFFSDIVADHPGLRYVGYDIVAELIAANRARYPAISFEQFDIVSAVPPRFDLVFCKELLIHLSDEQVKAVLANIRQSGSTYFMASNSFGVENIDLEHNYLGYARPIDLLAKPFSLPAPLWRNNFYALWSASDL